MIALTYRRASGGDDALHVHFVAASNPMLRELPAQVMEHQAAIQLSAYRREFASLRIEFVELDAALVARLMTAVDGSVLRLVDVVVDEAHRGQGLGRTIVSEVIARARRQGCVVDSTVRHDNAASLRLHTTLGFEEVSRNDQYVFLRHHAPDE